MVVTEAKPVEFDLSFPKAHGDSLGQCAFRSEPEDFQVDEILGFEPEGEGEHLYLHLQKTSTNTQWIVKQLGRALGVKERDIGFCGLKDKHAVATQWFSIYLPKNKQATFNGFEDEELASLVTVLKQSWSTKKLRRGMHASNHFNIRLRHATFAREPLVERLEQIKQQGVPNYFGEQRFGREGNNLVMANQMWAQGVRIGVKSQKTMAISAARSYLFNAVLAQRIVEGCWTQAIEGDVIDEQGGPTAPLWGRGRSKTAGLAAEIEHGALAECGAWQEGLEHCGLSQERRALVLMPKDLAWTITGDDIHLSFALPPGQYATSLLSELGECVQAYPIG